MQQAKNLILLQKALSSLYPKCFNRNETENAVLFTKKKEGIIAYYTIDDYHALYKIADITHSRTRRWIKRRKKRKLVELQALKKKDTFFTAQSIVLSLKTNKLNFKMQQAIQFRTFLPFVNVNYNYSYINSIKRMFLQKNKKTIFYILKPRKGGYNIFFSGLIGFFHRKQGKIFFRLRKKKRGFFKGLITKNKFPKPVQGKNFINFKAELRFIGPHTHKKLSKTKIKKLKHRFRANLKLTVRLFLKEKLIKHNKKSLICFKLKKKKK